MSACAFSSINVRLCVNRTFRRHRPITKSDAVGPVIVAHQIGSRPIPRECLHGLLRVTWAKTHCPNRPNVARGVRRILSRGPMQRSRCRHSRWALECAAKSRALDLAATLSLPRCATRHIDGTRRYTGRGARQTAWFFELISWAEHSQGSAADMAAWTRTC